MPPAVDHYTVIGNPIAHSRSPWLHAQFAQQTQQAMHYDRSLLAVDDFAAGLARLRNAGLMGCNVTVPFKNDAFKLAQWHSPAALLAQACNTLWWDADTLKADNTDGIGLVRDITHNAHTSLAGKRVLIIGAGGAGAGILGPLLAAGCSHIHLANRTLSKAQALVLAHQTWAHTHRCGLSVSALAHIPNTAFDLIINASASSLGGEHITLPNATVDSNTLAIDLMYGPPSRVFLDWASALGARTRDGLGMLVEQAAQSFSMWRGVMPSTHSVLAELRAMVDTPGA